MKIRLVFQHHPRRVKALAYAGGVGVLLAVPWFVPALALAVAAGAVVGGIVSMIVAGRSGSFALAFLAWAEGFLLGYAAIAMVLAVMGVF